MRKMPLQIDKSLLGYMRRLQKSRRNKTANRSQAWAGETSGRKNELMSTKKKPDGEVRRVLIEVLEERQRQEKKWGVQNHNPFLYLSILGEEVGEANRAAIEAFDWKKKLFKRFPDNSEVKLKHLREELVQVAAVAVALVECLDRDEWEG